MNDKEVLEILNTKGRELSEWLKENFNPYTAIVITDTEVKIVTNEYCVPTTIKSENSDASCLR